MYIYVYVYKRMAWFAALGMLNHPKYGYTQQYSSILALGLFVIVDFMKVVP